MAISGIKESHTKVKFLLFMTSVYTARSVNVRCIWYQAHSFLSISSTCSIPGHINWVSQPYTQRGHPISSSFCLKFISQPTLLQKSVNSEAQFLHPHALKFIPQATKNPHGVLIFFLYTFKFIQQTSFTAKIPEQVGPISMAVGRKNRTRCELCSKDSALRCEADCANLCWECDAKVHSANFLVARHFRTVLCCRCHGQTCTAICGACPSAEFRLCRTCSELGDSRQNADMKVLSVLKRWYRALNLSSPCTVSLAMNLVEKGRVKQGNLFKQKIRVYLAAALWSAATVCENEGSLPRLKRVEECTGIPVKLIVSAQSRCFFSGLENG
ncbi:uncharacterized protein LOC131047882 [Cryptomeria japonica]|uniref:uncharacterized protein LOC131047882 n=1 Tax=Cryptomeria japonica TaxID=3369 RepID=UPI0025AC6E0C|nr:uncharacterized protein LOC131047882 [Cryptomeria japonica]